MAGQVRLLINWVALASIAAMLGITLFFMGFWAGSARGGGNDTRVHPIAGYSWTYDAATSNPRCSS
jgi:hypothetical protein